MATQRRLLPIAAFVAVLITLVAVRLWAGSSEGDPDSDAAPVTSPADERSGAEDELAVDEELVGGIEFTDVTEEAGLDTLHSSTELSGESAMTAGAAATDIDDDGDVDLYLTRVGATNQLLINDGRGNFSDATDDAGVPGNDPDGGSSAAGFADADADGDPDLVVTGAGRNGTVLYLNDGSGRFSDGTAGSGLDDLPPVPDGELAQMHGVTFADYDRDGRLDLLLTHWDDVIPAALADPSAESIRADDDPDGSLVCARAAWLREQGFPRAADAPANRGRLYRNEGDGRFADVSEQVGLPFSEILGFTGSFADIDDDGWDDLLITGDFCTSRVFRNVDGERFEDITTGSSVATDENGMGSVVRDLNADGLPDWFITSIGPVGDATTTVELGGFGSSGNRAFLNDGDGTFTDATDQLGLRNGGWGWGAAIEDFGNDGRLSVVMTNGYSIEPDGADAPPGTAADDPMIFWVPDGDSFVDVASSVGLDDTGLGRALVPFDMDRDGDLDLLVTNIGRAPLLYRNDSPSRHWLTVALDDPTTPGNRAGIGAEVAVFPTPDGPPVTQWVRTGGSYESQVPAEIHVGLGGSANVDRVEVTWPGDDTPQVLTDVDADQLLEITRSA